MIMFSANVRLSSVAEVERNSGGCHEKSIQPPSHASRRTLVGSQMALTLMRVLAPYRPICGALEEWPQPKESFEAVAYESKLNLAASHGLVPLEGLDREAPKPADREVLQLLSRRRRPLGCRG
jgi:hypothetical protein